MNKIDYKQYSQYKFENQYEIYDSLHEKLYLYNHGRQHILKSPPEHPMELFMNLRNSVTNQVSNTVYLWLGLSRTHFMALTPDMLTQLNDRCQKINDDIEALTVLSHECERSGYIQDGKFLSVIGSEVMRCITLSYKLSNGEDVEYTRPILDKEHYAHDIFKLIKVEPWEMPPFPEKIIPVKSPVVLKVMTVLHRHVKAGIDDLFNPLVVSQYLQVDEELAVGDRIIVKARRWNPERFQLESDEYDGKAEADCPVSTEQDFDALNTKFEEHRQQQQRLTQYRKNWLEKHWTVLNEYEIIQMCSQDTSEFSMNCKNSLETSR